LKSWAAWAGSEEHYKGVFRKRRNTDASAYFVADAQAIKDEYAAMAALRQCSMPEGTPVDLLDFRCVMPVGMADRCQQHEQSGWKREGKDGLYVADVDQNTTHYKGGDVLGSLVTHGCIYNFQLRRPLVPLEHMWVQGLPVLGQPLKSATFTSCVQPLLNSKALCRKQIKHLAGNAMHCPTVTSVLIYALAKALPRACGSTDGAELSNDTHGKSNKASEAVEGLDDQASAHDSPFAMQFVDDGSQQLF